MQRYKATDLFPAPRALSRTKSIILALSAAIFLTAAVVSFKLSGPIMDAGIHKTVNLWFDADTDRVFSNLTDRHSNHYRNSVHPISSLLISTPTLALIGLGIAPVLAVRIMMAIGAGFFAVAFFAASLWITKRLLDALVYTLLLLASAAFLFFVAVPETYVWGATTILLAILSVRVQEPYTGLALVLGNAASLSITVTNWMAGLVATFVAVGFKPAVKYTVVAFALVAALSGLQSNAYQTSGPFLKVAGERNYATIDVGARILGAPRVFLVDPVIFPGFRPLDSFGEAPKHILPQTKGASWRVTPATLVWSALLLAGLIGASHGWKSGRISRSAVLIPVILLGQIILHVFYGEVAFLYSLHYAPLVVLLAAFASRTRLRVPCLAGALVVTLLAAASNYSSLNEATLMLGELVGR